MTRIGRQDPTITVVLPYKKTKGGDAVDLYSKTGRTAQEWQKKQVNNIMAINKDGLWVHTKYGYTVPRRNGKTEIVLIRELYALLNGEKVLHTAHRVTTSSKTAARLASFLKDKGYKEVLRPQMGVVYHNSYCYAKQTGQERIAFLDEGGGEVNFRTRTSVGGLGEGYDLLVIDEAQEYTTDQQNTLQFVVSDSNNPQIIMLGTPPTAVSKGTVFTDFRGQCLKGETEDAGWAEWSVENKVDVNDVEKWYECNPAMGYQLNERKIRAEDKTDFVDYNIQRFGWWATYNQQSDINIDEWSALTVESAELTGKRFIGIKFSKEGSTVSMSACSRCSDESIFGEVLGSKSMREGTEWMVSLIIKNSDKIQSVVIDGANGQNLLAKDLKDSGVKTKVILPKVKDVIDANAAFENAITQQKFKHLYDFELNEVATNCSKRAIGTNGGFGYKSIKDGCDITLLDSMILAHWSCAESKEIKKQRVSY